MMEFIALFMLGVCVGATAMMFSLFHREVRKEEVKLEECKHKWGMWKEPEIGHYDRTHIQLRGCSNCGIAEKRIVE